MKNTVRVFEVSYSDWVMQEWPQDIVLDLWHNNGLLTLLENVRDMSKNNDATIFVVVNDTEIVRYRNGVDVSYLIHEDATWRISNATQSVK